MQSMPEPLVRPLQPCRAADQHPAVEAWTELGGEPVLPQIEILKYKNKSKVYRLRPVRGGIQPDVIAKWCRSHTAQGERFIYDEVLAHLPMQALRCYGSLPDAA